jgi:hypothetical protein
MIDNPVTAVAFLFFLFVVVILVMRAFRRWAGIGRSSRNAKPVNYDFTIGELNELLRAGKLSPDEFEKAKSAVLKRAAVVPPALPPKGARGFDVLQRSEGEDAGAGAGEDSSRDAR